MLSIGQKLYSIRIEKGITQAKLAEVARIPQPALSNIEQGKRDMTVSTLLRLCHAMDVLPARIFEDQPSGFKKIRFTRQRIEIIAKAVWDPTSAVLDENERLTVDLLREVLPVGRNRKSQKSIYFSWNQLRQRYTQGEIQLLAERVRDEEMRRHAKKSH